MKKPHPCQLERPAVRGQRNAEQSLELRGQDVDGRRGGEAAHQYIRQNPAQSPEAEQGEGQLPQAHQ